MIKYLIQEIINQDDKTAKTLVTKTNLSWRDALIEADKLSRNKKESINYVIKTQPTKG